MKESGSGGGLSRGSKIAVAVAIGVALGCAFAFWFPDGFFESSFPSRDQTGVKVLQVCFDFGGSFVYFWGYFGVWLYKRRILKSFGSSFGLPFYFKYEFFLVNLRNF